MRTIIASIIGLRALPSFGMAQVAQQSSDERIQMMQLTSTSGAANAAFLGARW